MRVGIATDHGGFGLKEELRGRLAAAGHDVVEFGAFKLDSGDDYPDFVVPLARAVAAGKVERGVAVCGSGVGATVCANKVPGARACLITDHFSARQGVEDDHMNIIEHHLSRWSNHRPNAGLGPCRGLLGCRVQPGGASSATAGQGRGAGNENHQPGRRRGRRDIGLGIVR